MPYVIVSECESGFWSNHFGWVFDRTSASVFQSNEVIPAPLRHCCDGNFLEVALAPEFYLAEHFLAGDRVIRNNPDRVEDDEVYRIEKIRTADGCARRCDDVVVLRTRAGAELEVCAGELSPAYAGDAALLA